MNIICIGNIGWDYLWQRPQQIMSRLALNNKVIYVEEPKSLLRYIRSLSFSSVREQDNLLVFTPIGVPFGLHKYDFFKKVNFFLLYIHLKYIVRKYGLKQNILWFYNIRMGNLIGKMNECLIIYDCVDEHSAFSGSSNKDRKQELKIIELSDIIFTSSDKLYTSRSILSDSVYLVKNAADTKHFLKCTNSSESEGNLSIQKPIVGYVGAIHDWVDLELISFLARSRPEISVVLIGPVSIDTSVINLPNVHMMGQKNFDLLPKYMQNFDVCIIPFKINELTINADPIKLYEYMATGKTIVSTDLPEASKFSCVKIARTYDEFVGYTIDSIYNKPSTTEINKQIETAKINSWENRVKEMENVISTVKLQCMREKN